MAKIGRPKKDASEKVKNHIIAVDYADYLTIKSYCVRNRINIKALVSELIRDL